MRTLLALTLLLCGACGGIAQGSVPPESDAGTSDPALRYANAICACGGSHEGCVVNALTEVTGLNAGCLDARAAGYEVDCSGRTNANCDLYAGIVPSK